MTITIITLFPAMFESIFAHSIMKRAQEEEKLMLRYINLKEYGIGAHKMVDDTPYGGGVGMVLKVDVIDQAIEAARLPNMRERVVLLDPKGRTYTQNIATEFTQIEHLILICGHYEGFDERIRMLVDDEVSVGDYVLSGGEIAAMAIVESVGRLLPGVLKKEEATQFESFTTDLLEHAQYTRPREYKGMSVPDILLSGHAAKIKEHRQKDAEELTKKRRPDLVKKNI